MNDFDPRNQIWRNIYQLVKTERQIIQSYTQIVTTDKKYIDRVYSNYAGQFNYSNDLIVYIILLSAFEKCLLPIYICLYETRATGARIR